MMFGKQLSWFLFLWFMLVLGTAWTLLHSSPKSEKAYHKLMSKNDQNKKEPVKEKPRMTQQTREQISKQMLYIKDHQRLQSRLESEFSDLTYNPSEQGAELVERFQNISCSIQEELLAEDENQENGQLLNQQLLRHLKARQAIYSYQTGQLKAEDVELSRYLIAGHAWVNCLESTSPLLKGKAKQVELSLFQEPSFKAQGFQASFHEWGNEW